MLDSRKKDLVNQYEAVTTCIISLGGITEHYPEVSCFFRRARYPPETMGVEYHAGESEEGCQRRYHVRTVI